MSSVMHSTGMVLKIKGAATGGLLLRFPDCYRFQCPPKSHIGLSGSIRTRVKIKCGETAMKGIVGTSP
jgi:hypothetical protein